MADIWPRLLITSRALRLFWLHYRMEQVAWRAFWFGYRTGRLVSSGFDLTSYRASQAEIAKETFPVKLGVTKDENGNEHEETIQIPGIRDWPIEAQAKLGQGDIVGGITDLVGPEGAELFRAFNWTFGEFQALFEALSQWSGFQMGRPSVPQPVLGSTRTSN